MTYDLVNRLETKTLPNGVKTTYGYDLLDRVISLVYTKADGTVLASQTYTRNPGGEPSKIVREDGSYTEYDYDAAFRLSKEVSYTAAGVAVRSIEYSYDLDGKRTRKVDNLGTHDYTYNAQGQLDTVGTDGYGYDADGRLKTVTKTGQTLDLVHDTFDRLTQVTNNGTTTQYLYDANGNRIKEISGANTKNYLVAPNVYDGLESTDLVTDGSGNVVSDYVYGGSEIIARLDAFGNPIYYLTDDMGSVIGLVDASGNIQSRIIYDGFGNVISGDDGSSQGGDFRFQGQWLEGESGLYYMRARDYDAQAGLFLSRDPINVEEQEIEAFNPYQFAYGNPFIYGDPTGQFTLSEINVAQSIQSELQRQFYTTFRDRLIDEAKGVVGKLLASTTKKLLLSLVPGSEFADGLNKVLNGTTLGGQIFEKLLTQAICDLLGRDAYSQYLDRLWLQAKVKVDGTPTANGLGCGTLEFTPSGVIKTKGLYPKGAKGKEPDFLIKEGGPYTTDPVIFPGQGYNKAFLIGDVKATWLTVLNGLSKPQGRAILNYAKYSNRHQFVPIAMFVTAIGGSKASAEQIVKKGLEKNVYIYTLTLFPFLSKQGTI
jgi:RHS repeat-associated protein